MTGRAFGQRFGTLRLHSASGSAEEFAAREYVSKILNALLDPAEAWIASLGGIGLNARETRLQA
ncbi:hypothetical protein J2X02_003478 [Pseudoxanthomonas japonensis]|uniref:hypothetical protein n=1 Tax=Pseudoxanthomonas japonensis TaxID=69284 RepID=UPI0028675D41|nr:hypothetical protein [Pseudoxanthomonas japonensis]MDR7070613.1 hypothetical protein [Pseudoxanthomonas japonensis]